MRMLTHVHIFAYLTYFVEIFSLSKSKAALERKITFYKQRKALFE